MHHPTPPYDPTRRGFISFVTNGLGAIFAVILGAPAVGYILDPLSRAVGAASMRLVEGVRFDQLATNVPIQGVIRDIRRDGWTLYPSDTLGRVWVVKRTTGPLDPERLRNMTQEQRNEQVAVFTTICPHLGCSVNFNGSNFACPCHAAQFAVNGTRLNDENPAQRGMDTLDWTVDDVDPNRLRVVYLNFQASVAEKVTV